MELNRDTDQCIPKLRYGDRMPRILQERGRKSMTISVTILGLTLLTVLMAYLVFGDSTDKDNLASLRLIGILFRHGDRTPTELYPNDPHLKHVWPGGLGALTETGSLQMYNLGKNLRQRYYKLLPENSLYTKENMHVLSSYRERCIMSALSFLAGFMPPLENRHKLPIPWQPIPISSLPREQDYLLVQKKPCPKYDDLLQKLYANASATEELKKINEDNAELFEYLTKHSGKNISNILHVEFLYNTLSIEKNAGLELPEWTENVFPDKMLPLAERNLALLTETQFMKKIKGGAVLTEILDNMIKKRSHLLVPERSIFVYSGHDVTLVNLMRALDITEHTSRKPDFAATLVFELHHSVVFEDDFEIKIVYYFNSDDKFPKEIPIPNCNAPCSLTQFTKAVEKITFRNYDELCKQV